MSDETPGAGQGALPPREAQGPPRPAAERPTMRLTQVAGGQYVLTSQSPGVPALAQISPGTALYTNANLVQGGVTRIISISPSRVTQSGAPLRPSLANQSIVNVLTKPRPNIRLQLFQGGEASSPPTQQLRALKRPLSQTDKQRDRDSYPSKLQRVMNHKIVRQKLVKEKYSEHLLEAFYLEAGGNILDLYQYAKRPKSQAYANYLKEHAIEIKMDVVRKAAAVSTDSSKMTNVTVSTPSATSTKDLPGISTPTVASSSTSSNTSSTDVVTATPTASSSLKTLSIRPNNNTTTTNQEQIVEKAKQEAYVVSRISDLQKEGLWSEKRLPKVQDMPRTKAHWDYLLEEMVWLAADFAQERKWKKAAAKKCARMVQKYFQDKAQAALRAEKAQEQHLKRIAGFCAKEIKGFWNNVEKLVEYKQNTILEEKRKKALDQQLSFIVDQTEKYSQLLAEGMNKSVDVSVAESSVSRVVQHSDEEFEPEMQSDEDDEETIEQEEATAVGGCGEETELADLQRESQLDLSDLLEDELLRGYLLNRDNIRMSDSEESYEDHQEKSKSVRKRKPSQKTIVMDEEDSKSAGSEDEEEEEEETEEDSDEETSRDHNMEESDADELKLLVEDSQQNEGDRTKTDNKNDDLINDAAAIAESIQPKGNTLSSTSVSTIIPFLLKFTLREYQHIGLDWLVTMYERKLNGILADEMGLGKTIQTIALLAHLACEKENWGPHLIVVPTSVMLNWEMECKKWCPAFKILTYYGSQKERKLKRTGWTKTNAFHICITSYKLVIQDHQSFRRKKWKYLILDEAQNIKNFKSQRWQLLLNFQTQQRLLLTGTPLQNNLMELWSLMHFLMPNVFQSHREFKEWFSNPVTGMIEGNSEYNESIIKRLHKVLRPFLLRRLKSEVEKQMPKKYEHVVMCRLSKRQRFLYDDYMSRAKTRETLATGNLLSVINVLMQLRKVCNHPNLFEVRPTISPFQSEGIRLHIPSVVYSALEYDPWKHVDLYSMNFLLIMLELHLSAYQCYRMRQTRTPCKVIETNVANSPPPYPPGKMNMRVVKLANNEMDVVKNDNKAKVLTTPQNVKVKLSGVQLVSQQGIVKTIPVVNISQATSSQVGTPVNVTSVLKPADKISASFAQLVQTSTGKHLLLTSNPNITGNIPVSTTPGHKLTFLSKQPVSTAGNASSHQITKAFVKFQLTSVTTATTATTVTTSSSSIAPSVKSEETKDDSKKNIGVKFIEQLYAKQSNNLDVRWGGDREDDEEIEGLPNEENPRSERRRRLQLMARINERRCTALPLYGRDFHNSIKIFVPNSLDPWVGGRIHCMNTLFNEYLDTTTNCLMDMMYTPERRIHQLKDVCERFIFYVPAVKAAEPELQVWHPPPSKYWGQKTDKQFIQRLFSKPATPLHQIASAMVTQFPDPRLIQYDCGKLQTLDKLLRRLKQETHRVLIFTQMTKMLDILEAFLNFHGHIYLRLDGTTKVDQRQVLMERFNGDTRIFAFILSTRSGGIGVNLTGADTVIFYDSDWNPTMDAQAQDRCHRIGQTRDVHIYRLISERTIEENILKKANQKRLLGDLAIEGGNFTTAYFKSSTIQDLFNIDNDASAASRMSEVVEASRERESRAITAGNGEQVVAAAGGSDDKVAVGALEHALAACEDDQDVIAARTAKAEAVADLAEFDENIPLEDGDKEREPEMSKAEQEIDNVIKKLSPIERYAMRFIEETESAWSAEQLKAAEREIEEQKREWEKNRLAAMREEEERRARELEEDANDMLTYSREDASNQIWVSNNTTEQMPMWCPPTPPEQHTDVYVDQTMSFLYNNNIMSETQLPPIYVKKEPKRSRLEAGLVESRRALKMQRKDTADLSPNNAPKSLFHSAAILKMRRDLKIQKYRGIMRGTLVNLPGKSTSGPSVAVSVTEGQQLCHEWTIHEDMALLKVIQLFQSLPLNLFVSSPGHTANWDFVADYVNSVSITYRSPKLCRHRYESSLMQREEGKQIFDDSAKKKKKLKTKSAIAAAGGSTSPLQKFAVVQQQATSKLLNRPMRTSQLYTQDNNATFSQLMVERYEALKAISISKKMPTTTRTTVMSTTSSSSSTPIVVNKTKHAAMLTDNGIDWEHPMLPVDVAVRRAERIAKEKKTMTPEAHIARLQLLKANMLSSGHAAVGTAGGGAGGGAGGTVSSAPVVVSVSQQQQQQIVVSQAPAMVSSVGGGGTVVQAAAPGTPPNATALRTQRIIASPLQSSTVVSVSGLNPVQLQAATRLMAASGGGVVTGQTKAGVVTGTATMQGKTLSAAQLHAIRQAAALKQQLRMHSSNLQAAAAAQGGSVKTSTVTIGGQQAVVQFTQAQPRAAPFIRQGTMTISGKAEMAQLLRKQQQQQKLAAAVAASGGAAGSGVSGGGGVVQQGTTTVQGLSPQVFAQAIQQAGSSGGTSVATLVKAVSTAGGVTQTVTIPVTGVTFAAAAQGKTLTPTLKTTNPQLRQIQIQQQILTQKKLGGQKLSIAQVTGKNNVPTQLIVGPKQLNTALQFQQVIRTPLNVSPGPVVLAKGPPRVIPVNTTQGTKQTIQVVTATSQALNAALRPQAGSSSALAGALTGIKVQTGSNSAQSQLLSQVSVALNQQNVRQMSPVRIQTSTGTPIVAVSVQSASVATAATSQTTTAEQVNRFLKK